MFLKNKNIILKIRRSKVTDYAALTRISAPNGLDKDHLAFTFTRFDMGDNSGPGQTWLSVMDIRHIYGKLVLIRKKGISLHFF